MYLLDTHVLSEIRKASRTKAASPRIDLHVHRWLKGVSALDLYVSVVTILELERGYHLLKDRDEPQADGGLDLGLGSFGGHGEPPIPAAPGPKIKKHPQWRCVASGSRMGAAARRRG